MFDGKFICTLIAIVVAILAIFNMKTTSNEGFGFGGLPSMTWKAEKVVAPNMAQAKKGDFFSAPMFQSNLSPRFANLSYGANIQYNLPAYDNLAVPFNPLTFGKMAKENYVNSPPSGCNQGQIPINDVAIGGAPIAPAGYADGNYNNVLDNTYRAGQYADTNAMVPVGDMTTLNALGESTQPIIYDRYIFANRNSRLRSQGDPIRGDLPIVPINSDWFRPSVQPNIDLQEGAMNVLGGINNETSQSLAALMNASAGNALDTFAGVNMTPQYRTALSGGQRDVNVVAYP